MLERVYDVTAMTGWDIVSMYLILIVMNCILGGISLLVGYIWSHYL